MTVNLIQSSSPSIANLTYPVLIQQQNEEYIVTVLGLDCKAKGSSREAALEQLLEQVNAMLKQSEIVQLEIPLPKSEHPWMKFAGMYKDNPLFDEVQNYIKADRDQLDAEMKEYYFQLEAKEEIK
ncbi:MAG: type II toxin-antitoxin system HicB family antitoxin [Planktothrix sp.]|uniref:type II toxin-antitoxin system HicB family antitoxin n=1 Tax=Planktothrix sp. TaxID=3088171 RepID=UPI0038D4E895